MRENGRFSILKLFSLIKVYIFFLRHYALGGNINKKKTERSFIHSKINLKVIQGIL